MFTQKNNSPSEKKELTHIKEFLKNTLSLEVTKIIIVSP